MQKTYFSLIIFCSAIFSGNELYPQETFLNDSIFLAQRNAIHLKIDSIFEHLDTGKFNSGFLYNRVILPIAGVNKYDGISDSIISAQNWFQLYFELNEYASYRTNSFPHALILNNNVKEKIKNGVIPLGIINLQYHLIKEQAIDSGWVYLQNQRAYENPESPVSQYEAKKAFAIAPLVERKLPSSINFIIDTSFYFSQKTDTLLFFEIDFGDGAGFRTLHFGEQITINYQAGGEMQINSKAHFSNGEMLHSNSTVNILDGFSVSTDKSALGPCNPTPGDCNAIGYGNYLAPDDIWQIETTAPYDFPPGTSGSVVIGTPADGIYARGRAYIKYGCGNIDKRIRKPFIFVEGINFEDTDLNAQNYGCDDNAKVQYGDIGWPQIISGDDKGADFPLEKLQIEKLPNLIKKLCADGYDLIMLDFKDGDYYMQENAMVLVELIKKVNLELPKNGFRNQIVVLGASMGGQVSRFALRYMENKYDETGYAGWNHNTRLWISYDSPNMGANVPLGMQYAIKWMTLIEAGTANAFSGLLSPATRQLLIYYYHATASDGTAGSDPLRTEIYNDPNMQFPKNLRKIAIANGSGYARDQGYSAGNQILKLDNNAIQMDIYALPNDQSGTKNTVFHGMLTTTSTITTATTTIIGWFHFWPFKAITETIIETINTIVENHSSDKVKNTLPYDNTSGGQRVSIYTLVNKLQSYPGGFGSGVVDNLTHDYHSFIPTFSALGLQPTVSNTTSDLNAKFNAEIGLGGIVQLYPLYPSSYSSPLTPFDAVYAPYYNETHMRITEGISGGDDFLANNSHWIKDEVSPEDLYLQNRPQNNPIVANTPLIGYSFDTRNTISIGSDVDPIKPNASPKTRTPVGEFIVESDAMVDVRAGHEIIVKNGTWFKKGSNVRLFIQPFQCNAVCRMANTNNDSDNAGGKHKEENPIASANKDWTDFVYDEMKKTEPSKPMKEAEILKPANIFPNPFNDHLHIDYSVQEEGPVYISVYNLTGQKMAELVSTYQHQMGNHTATFDARKLSPGIYYIRITVNDKSETMKVVKMK